MKAIVVTIICIFILIPGCTKIMEEHASISFIIGDVKKNDKITEIGDELKQNDVLVTGIMSSCDVRIGDSIIRIKEKSRVALSDLFRGRESEKVVIDLAIGKVLCKTKKLVKNSAFIVKTPTAVAGVRGTLFTVETDKNKTSRIKVFEGKIKVSRRVRQFENYIEKMVDESAVIEEKQKVIVTEKEVKKIEHKVERSIGGNSIDPKIADKVLAKHKSSFFIPEKMVSDFKAEDFQNEKNELISIKTRSEDVIKKINKFVKIDREKPQPEGRLLITRHDVYFIQKGRVVWEGNVIKPPVTHENNVYIASGNFVFCASVDGHVVWKTEMDNDGSIEVIDHGLRIITKGKPRVLNLMTGK